MGFNNIFKMVLATTLLSSGSSSQLYNLVATTIQGDQVDFGGFEGRVVLMVNVASQCGYTDGHYRGLQRLHDILGQDGKLEILGKPAKNIPIIIIDVQGSHVTSSGARSLGALGRWDIRI